MVSIIGRALLRLGGARYRLFAPLQPASQLYKGSTCLRARKQLELRAHTRRPRKYFPALVSRGSWRKG